jgi:hypothetical protein
MPGSESSASTAPASPLAAPDYATLLTGDALPTLRQRCGGLPNFSFECMAGRYILFCFFVTAEDEAGRRALAAVHERRDLFDDRHCSFVGVSTTTADHDERKLHGVLPGIRYAWDFDFAMSRLCGSAPQGAIGGVPTTLRRFWLLVDPSLHVLQFIPFGAGPEAVINMVAALPPPDEFGGVARPAPILMLPNVFEPELCRELIADYEAGKPEESGVLRNGLVLDSSFKRRRDHTLSDPRLIRAANTRIWRRVRPEIERVFFMQANYIERHIVGCYAATDGGHFKAHFDNGPGPSAHRRFAVSINLNGGFEGGEVAFPEYGTKGYKAPAGWALIFPCGILHQVERVTAGVRYAFLPFLHDEAGEAIRRAEWAKAGSAMEGSQAP